MTDYTTSNLGGLRNRHLDPDATIDPHARGGGPIRDRQVAADDPPKRRRRSPDLVQLEVPGAERPRILPIDDAVRDLLAVEEEIAALKVRRASAQLTIQNLLVEHGCAVYVYVDGEFEWPVRMTATEKLVVKKRKRRTSEDVKHDTNDGRSPDKEA